MTKEEALRMLDLIELNSTLDKILKYNRDIRVSQDLPFGIANEKHGFVIKAELFKPAIEIYKLKVCDELKALGYEE